MINQVILVGRLVRDTEVIAGPRTSMARMRIATDQVFTDQDGVRQQRSQFHDVVAFGRAADMCGSLYLKGRLTYIQGRLRTRDYDGTDGVRRYRTEIVADTLRLLDRAGRDAGSNEADPAPIPLDADDDDAPACEPLRVAMGPSVA